MKVKTMLFLLLSGLMAVSCSNERRNEKAIEQTLELFYKHINERDFKAVSAVCSPQMQKSLDFMKNFGNDLVVYKDWVVKSVKVSGNKAVAKVLVTDQFDNRTECIWKLSKVKDKWLLDVFNFSSAENLEPVKESPNNATKAEPAPTKAQPAPATESSTTKE